MAHVIWVFLVSFLFALVFMISGMIINIIQALTYLCLYNRNRSLYRKINYYLIYTSWSQVLAMAEWWSGSSCNLYGDEESLKMFGKEHSIVVMNHTYETDWLMCWFVCDKLGMLGNAKTCAKKSLRRVPVIGWGWIFAEMIFLERDWDKDKLTLGPMLDDLVEYDDPVMLLYFCEGTRFTEEKHKTSMEFAKAGNLPQLKHHLCPRTKGFTFAVRHVKSKISSVYDVQLAFPDGALKPTFSNMLLGHSFVGDMYVRRFPVSEVPTDSDEAISKWLHQLYQEKDQAMDNYLKTNTFPGKHIKLQRSVCSLINLAVWTLLIGVPFLVLLFKLLFMGNSWITAVTVTMIVLLFSGLYMMVGVTKADKGSSYGKDKKTPGTAQNGVLNANEINGECEHSKEYKKESHNSHLPDAKEIPKIVVNSEQNIDNL